MAKNKTMHVLWSKSVLNATGAKRSLLRKKFLNDLGNFLPNARNSFLHAISSGDSDMCYLFTGTEFPTNWKVLCQIARYRPMPPPVRDDHPNAKLRGKIIKLPEAVNEPDNEVFEDCEDICELP